MGQTMFADQFRRTLALVSDEVVDLECMNDESTNAGLNRLIPNSDSVGFQSLPGSGATKMQAPKDWNSPKIFCNLSLLGLQCWGMVPLSYKCYTVTSTHALMQVGFRPTANGPSFGIPSQQIFRERVQKT